MRHLRHNRSRGSGSVLRAGVFALVAAVGVAGCAEVQFLSQASKEVADSEAKGPGGPAPDPGPRYKIGNAYQIKGVWYYPKVDYDYREEGIASWYGPNFHGKQTANGAIFDMNKVSAAHRTLPLPSMVRVTNLENGRSIKVLVNDRGPFARNRIIDLSRRGAELLGFINQGTALVRVEVLSGKSRRLAAETGGVKPARQEVAEAPPPRAAPTPDVESESLPPPPGVAEAELPSDEHQVAHRGQPSDPEQVERQVASSTTTAEEEVTVVGVPESPDIFVQAGAFAQHVNAVRAQALLRSIGPVQVEQINRSETPLFRVRVGPIKGTERADSVLLAIQNAGFEDARIVVTQ